MEKLKGITERLRELTEDAFYVPQEDWEAGGEEIYKILANASYNVFRIYLEAINR